ncbi:MAG: DUF1043 family protein [Pseudomonadota bacterium]
MESVQLSQAVLIALGAALFIIGLGLGALLGRRSAPAVRRQREAERKLDQILQEKKAYEDEVVEHFSETANLLNNLTESYRGVHNHLATGAANLCHGKGPVSMERLEDGPDSAEIPAHLADIRPPLDYAPKTSPEEKGMLNEEFGMDRKSSAEPTPVESAKPKPSVD